MIVACVIRNRDKRTCEQVFDRFDLIGALVHVSQTPAFTGGPVAHTGFADLTFQRAGRIERQLAGSLRCCSWRGLLRQFDQFSALGRHQQPVIFLQVSTDFSERRQFVRRIEVEKRAQARMLHGGDQRGIGDVRR